MRFAWPLLLAVGCSAAPPIAEPTPKVVAPEPDAPVAPPKPEAEASPPTTQLFVMPHLARMSDCGHDQEIGDLHCAFSTVGRARPVTVANHLRVFPTEPPGLVLAAIDFEPRDVVESELAIADCEVEQRGILHDVRVGAVDAVVGYLITGPMPVVTATQCTFEQRDVPTLRAAHLVVMHQGSPRSPQTRSRDEALAIAIRAAREPLPFGEIVARYSDEPGAAARGGDLGTFRPEMMVPEFALVVLGTPVGKRSAVFESSFGFHIVERR